MRKGYGRSGTRREEILQCAGGFPHKRRDGSCGQTAIRGNLSTNGGRFVVPPLVLGGRGAFDRLKPALKQRRIREFNVRKFVSGNLSPVEGKGKRAKENASNTSPNPFHRSRRRGKN